MTEVMGALLEGLLALHTEIRSLLEGMPDEALDWVPGPGMNTISATIVHSLGAERYWLGDVAYGEASGRDRDGEFRARGLGASRLLEQLAEADAYATKVFGGLDPATLATSRFSVLHGRDYAVAWAVAHTVEHSALHVGHLQVIRQLWHWSLKAGLGLDDSD